MRGCLIYNAALALIGNVFLIQEQFCDHVEEQYYRVSCQDESSLARKKIAEMVQKLKETRFFQ